MANSSFTVDKKNNKWQTYGNNYFILATQIANTPIEMDGVMQELPALSFSSEWETSPVATIGETFSELANSEFLEFLAQKGDAGRGTHVVNADQMTSRTYKSGSKLSFDIKFRCYPGQKVGSHNTRTAKEWIHFLSLTTPVNSNCGVNIENLVDKVAGAADGLVNLFGALVGSNKDKDKTKNEPNVIVRTMDKVVDTVGGFLDYVSKPVGKFGNFLGDGLAQIGDTFTGGHQLEARRAAREKEEESRKQQQKEQQAKQQNATTNMTSVSREKYKALLDGINSDNPAIKQAADSAGREYINDAVAKIEDETKQKSARAAIQSLETGIDAVNGAPSIAGKAAGNKIKNPELYGANIFMLRIYPFIFRQAFSVYVSTWSVTPSREWNTLANDHYYYDFSLQVSMDQTPSSVTYKNALYRNNFTAKQVVD